MNELEQAAMPLSEFAERAGVSLVTARRIANANEIPSFHVGHARFFSRPLAEQYLVIYSPCQHVPRPRLEVAS